MRGLEWLRALLEAFVEGFARVFGRKKVMLPPPEETGEVPGGPEGQVGGESAPGVGGDSAGTHKGPLHRRLMGGRH